MDTEKEINDLKAELAAIKSQLIHAEKSIKALIDAVMSIEEETGDEHMPSGEYYGIKF